MGGGGGYRQEGRVSVWMEGCLVTVFVRRRNNLTEASRRGRRNGKGSLFYGQERATVFCKASLV